MEILLFLLYPAGFVSIVTGLLLYLRSQEGARTLQIAKAHLTPAEDIETGYKAVADSVKALRAAKEEEDQLHQDEWEKEFYGEEYEAVLEKRRHEKELEDHKIHAKFIPAEQSKTVSARGWKRNGEKEDEELSYSQRRIRPIGAIVRVLPHDTAKTLGTMEGGSVWRFDGYVKGKSIAGNDIWFFYVGEKSGLVKYVWSGGTTNKSTSGLPYQGDFGYNELKYDPVPKKYIPSTVRKVYY